MKEEGSSQGKFQQQAGGDLQHITFTSPQNVIYHSGKTATLISKAIADCPTLSSVTIQGRLSNFGMRDALYALKSGARQLKILNLSNTQFSEKAVLGFYPSESIGVLATWLEDRLFSKEFQLTTLNLNGCNINNADIRCLAEVASKNRTLIRLSLRNNKFTDRGARALLKALETNRTLTYINLTGCDISQELCSKIHIALIRNKRTQKQLKRLQQHGVDPLLQQFPWIASTNALPKLADFPFPKTEAHCRLLLCCDTSERIRIQHALIAAFNFEHKVVADGSDSTSDKLIRYYLFLKAYCQFDQGKQRHELEQTWRYIWASYFGVSDAVYNLYMREAKLGKSLSDAVQQFKEARATRQMRDKYHRHRTLLQEWRKRLQPPRDGSAPSLGRSRVATSSRVKKDKGQLTRRRKKRSMQIKKVNGEGKEKAVDASWQPEEQLPILLSSSDSDGGRLQPSLPPGDVAVPPPLPRSDTEPDELDTQDAPSTAASQALIVTDPAILAADHKIQSQYVDTLSKLLAEWQLAERPRMGQKDQASSPTTDPKAYFTEQVGDFLTVIAQQDSRFYYSLYDTLRVLGCVVPIYEKFLTRSRQAKDIIKALRHLRRLQITHLNILCNRQGGAFFFPGRFNPKLPPNERQQMRFEHAFKRHMTCFKVAADAIGSGHVMRQMQGREKVTYGLYNFALKLPLAMVGVSEITGELVKVLGKEAAEHLIEVSFKAFKWAVGIPHVAETVLEFPGVEEAMEAAAEYMEHMTGMLSAEHKFLLFRNAFMSPKDFNHKITRLATRLAFKYTEQLALLKERDIEKLAEFVAMHVQVYLQSGLYSQPLQLDEVEKDHFAER